VKPGQYGQAVIHAGRDRLTLQGIDPDAVFLNGDGGIGLQIFPQGDQTILYPDLRGVTVRNLTIENVTTGIQVNQNGDPQNATLADPDNLRLRNLVVYLDRTDATAVEVFQSAVSMRHLTLVANAPGADLIHSSPGLFDSNAIYLQDNLLVALPNTAPLPAWWLDDNGNAAPTLNSHTGFASINGEAGDWQVAPAGNPAILMTRDDARFLDWSERVFRIGADSAARAQAGNGSDLGYYTYVTPVTVDASFCPDCNNDGLTWGVDAFNSIQAGIDSGAQTVLIDPGMYNEQIALVNGVSLFGSGAGLTYLAPPATVNEASGFLVGAENVRHTSLALLTVMGQDSLDGLMVDGDGSLTVQRAIIRNTGTAISIPGDSAIAILINDTLVNNDNGVSAVSCGNIDVRNSILAFHQGTALSYETASCPTSQIVLHTFNDFWRNGHDLRIDGETRDEPGPGELFTNPRFIDPDNQDFRLMADSPVVDAGDPSDPTPPGSGDRIDLGFAQAVEAAVYASKGYCEQCLNDGLEWQVTAFDNIQDALEHVPDVDGVRTVAVSGDANSAYHEHLQIPSGIRLVGSGARSTIIDGDDSGSVLTLDGATNVEISGFTITNGGEDEGDAGILATGASNQITLTRNVIGGLSPDNPALVGNGNAGLLFTGGSTGRMRFNTVVTNFGSGVVVANGDSWVDARYNIVAFNDAGLDNTGGGQIFTDYNLLYNTDTNWCGTCQDIVGTVVAGENDMLGEDPSFVDPDPASGDYRLALTSPAIDAVPAAFWTDVPAGGGDRADQGYAEVVALPTSLLLGKEGLSCALGNSGMGSVLVGVSYVPDPSLPVQETVPQHWNLATLSTAGDTGSYWNTGISFDQGDGLYRVYTRPIDQTGNMTSDPLDWFRSAVTVNSIPLQVTLLEPQPNTTTTAPGLHLRAAVAGALGPSQVKFLVDSAPITATATLDDQYSTVVALSNGPHTIQAKAMDSVRNTGLSPEIHVAVVTTANEAMLAEPVSGSTVSSPTINLQGYVHYQGKHGEGRLEVLVDSVSQGMADLAEPTAQSTSWSKVVSLAGEGDHTITLRPSRTQGAGNNRDTSATLTLDTTLPSVTVDSISQPITDTVTLSGSAADDGSGLLRVDVSVDGGRIWQPASLAGDGTWTLHWQAPQDRDFVSVRLTIRAMDWAGNLATIRNVVIVDNRPPVGPASVTFDPPQGSHLDEGATLQITWSSITDGSGEISVLAAVDQITDTVPSQIVSGGSFSANLNASGAWYAHLMVRDGTGNTMLRHYGPWNVASSAGENLPAQAIIVDGLVDVQHGEWLTARERLDDDTRPAGRLQELYAIWDDSYFFSAWQGALWALDGVMAVYLDVQAGGTADVLTVEGMDLGIAPLPMAADYAVTISGPQAGNLWRHDSSTGWQPDAGGGLDIAHASTGGVEFRLPRSIVGSGQVRMLALAVNDDGQLWSVFPTVNSLVVAATSTYTWNNLATDLPPNMGQPTTHHFQLSIGSPLAGTGYGGPDIELDYLIRIQNADNVPLIDATLDLQGSTGVGYQEVDGADCQSCPIGGDHWLLALPDIPPRSDHFVAVFSRLESDLAGIDQVSSDATIILTDGSTLEVSYGHLVDSRAPTVRVASRLTSKPGPRQIVGTATDDGIGVDLVRWRQAGQMDWQEAIGTRVWEFPFDMPATGSISLELQAVDSFGQESEIETATFVVDDVPPVVSFSLPSHIGGALIVVDGIVYDPYPESGDIQAVELQLNEDGPWFTVEGSFPLNLEGNRIWHILLTLPEVEGQHYHVRAHGIDAAGNVGEATDWQEIVIDSVAPRTLIAEPEPGDQVEARQTVVWGIARDGWGVAGVEVSVAGGPWQQAELGVAAMDLLAKTGRQPDLPEETELWALNVNLPVRLGLVAIQARATDWAGNIEDPPQKVRVHAAYTRLWFPFAPVNSDG
jgi:hypothetical protein